MDPLTVDDARARFPIRRAVGWTIGGTFGAAAVVTLAGVIPPDTVANAASAAALGFYALPIALALLALTWRFPAAASGIAVGLAAIGCATAVLMFWSPVPVVAAAAGYGLGTSGPPNPTRRAAAIAGMLVIVAWSVIYLWSFGEYLLN